MCLNPSFRPRKNVDRPRQRGLGRAPTDESDPYVRHICHRTYAYPVHRMKLRTKFVWPYVRRILWSFVRTAYELRRPFEACTNFVESFFVRSFVRISYEASYEYDIRTKLRTKLVRSLVRTSYMYEVHTAALVLVQALQCSNTKPPPPTTLE